MMRNLCVHLYLASFVTALFDYLKNDFSVDQAFLNVYFVITSDTKSVTVFIESESNYK